MFRGTPEPLDELLRELAGLLEQEFPLGPHSLHGPAHWSRVELYGLHLAKETGANLRVVRLFAIFHDCRRVHEGNDPGHGLRGAERARELRDCLPVNEDEFETLFQACAGHTDLRFSRDPTIGTCWDADRLDLDRVGVELDPDYLNTQPARLLCAYDKLSRRRMVGILPMR
jgi:uncharacterized protein